MTSDHLVRGATISPCRTWRFRLWRRWGRGPALNYVLLNPSTADETEDDNTVVRCERRARKLGYDAIIITNAYALRATDPRKLREAEDPVGPGNDREIAAAARDSEAVICGWGKHCSEERHVDVLEAIITAGRRPLALGINGDGSPQHPLYIAYSVEPETLPVA